MNLFRSCEQGRLCATLTLSSAELKGSELTQYFEIPMRAQQENTLYMFVVKRKFTRVVSSCLADFSSAVQR